MSDYLELAKKVIDDAPGAPELMLAQRRERQLEEAARRGLVVKRSKEPGWISLHDPTTGQWHEFPACDCFPSIVAEAGARRKGGAA